MTDDAAVEAARRILRQALDDEFIRPIYALGVTTKAYQRLLDACAVAIAAHTEAALKEQGDRHAEVCAQWQQNYLGMLDTAGEENAAFQREYRRAENALKEKEAETGLQCKALIVLGPEYTYNCLRNDGHDPRIWHKFLIDDDGVADLTNLRARLAAAEKTVRQLDLSPNEAGEMVTLRTRLAERERDDLTAERECWETGHTQQILMGDGTEEMRRLTRTHCPACVDAAMAPLKAAVEQARRTFGFIESAALSVGKLAHDGLAALTASTPQ